MNSICLLVMLLASNNCDHRMVVAGRDYQEFRLVIPLQRQVAEIAQGPALSQEQEQRGNPNPGQRPSAASVQPPGAQRDEPAQLPASMFPGAARASACSDGKCSSSISISRRWRRR